ncbi:SEP-domain-containing protein [Polychaeton citri CBS 116435]|uniref:SEP-domain-containing protein n=1 Tax=Polychaeton citri CBS 116435 TaxID=1314669 RepID=A0A9P4Q9W4_9PEZI|nr:SEP-domain-containing protein [Polychaeton citri CBS 116435]
MDQEAIAQFCGITGASPAQAQQLLSASNGNLEEAAQLYFTSQEEVEESDADENDDDDDEPQAIGQTSLPSGGQTLGGGPVPASASQPSSATRKPPVQQSKMRTIRDLQSNNESDEEEDKDPDMFAGGEKSGLAVQNPGQANNPANHFQNIMNQAKQNRERPAAANEEQPPQPTPQSSNFGGRAQTLGGDEAPSRVIDDPTSNLPGRSRQTHERVTRTLHLWDDGVSIDDGPLFRFDDPANASLMAQINQGRAPLSMLDVQPEQEVDLNLNPHKGEKYVQPKPKYKPFGGQGQRLGSPTPGIGGPSAAPSSATANTSTSASTASKPQEMQVDESAPTLTLQVRLGDGTRLQSRFNTTHTIGDVYDFVGRASPGSAGRSWALMTTFPSKELSDKSLALGDISDFKRGGVVVQKWT